MPCVQALMYINICMQQDLYASIAINSQINVIGSMKIGLISHKNVGLLPKTLKKHQLSLEQSDRVKWSLLSFYGMWQQSVQVF